ncbi:MAG: M28 family peptidase [Myxococcales bacterium]|nr:M28 family peptidase [Myxococcales bacterium]
MASTIVQPGTLGKLVLAALLTACERPPEPPAGELRFDGERALARVGELLTLPRALGDPARPAALDRLEALLRDAGAVRVERLEHTGDDPLTGRSFAMTTLVGAVRPDAPHQFILASHFDVRPWAESDPDPARRDSPIPGANDGTSGVAVLLELAPLLAAQLPPDIGFSLILFDGEELGRPGVGPYCAGSTALAAALLARRFPVVRAASFGVVLDMVGDRDLQLLKEPRSLRTNPELVDRIWSTGQAAGFPQFVAASAPEPLTDDHVPLSDVGIPSILVIDYTYPAWHTHADTIDMLSAASLGAVGETLRLALRAEWKARTR